MTNAEIKYRAHLYQDDIRRAKENLEAIQKWCKHEETFEGNWSWRPGAMHPAVICSFCGSCVKFK